ncbi:MAG: glycosyltransferase family 4 protein [Calditrichaeota bacterium]|nr:glycosyltransferase family 4 protein [Calditrichota bacterium]
MEANVVQVVQMCRAFASLGHEVTLFIPKREEFATRDAALARARELFGDSLGFKVVFVRRWKLFGRLEVLGSVKGTLSALRKYPQDLIYSRNPWSVGFLPRAGVPFVWEAHEERVHDRSKFLDHLLRSLIVKMSKKPELRKIVTISHALADVWEGYGVARAKLFAAHDGVDLDVFGNPPDRSATRKALGLDLERRLIVYTGSLKSDRGIEMILESARCLPEADFCIVGGTEEELAHWKAEAARLALSNLRFAGRVAHRDVPMWLGAADVLLMMWTWRVPTIRVCSPMKLFEYMAARRVIVGPDFPTVLEVLEHERDALLFEADNQDAMNAALRKGLEVCDDLRLPDHAYQKVAGDYTWTARCRQIIESLEMQEK